jgi:hypothetical protein
MERQLKTLIALVSQQTVVGAKRLSLTEIADSFCIRLSNVFWMPSFEPIAIAIGSFFITCEIE